MKAIKKPFFDLDNMVIRMKKPEAVRELKIRADLMEKYEAKLEANLVKEIEIMKINSENKCSHCSQVYNINVNKAGSCKNGSTHNPLY